MSNDFASNDLLRRGPIYTMLHPIRSILIALREAKDSGKRVLWIGERPAKLFHEPGWVELQPHRGGAVLFVYRSRAGNPAPSTVRLKNQPAAL